MINNRLNIVEEKICKLEDISNRNYQKWNQEENTEKNEQKISSNKYNICITRFSKRSENEGRKNIWRTYKKFKFDDKYKPRYLRISMNPKHMKHKENNIKAHNNQIAQNQWKRKDCRRSQRKIYVT